MEEVLALSLEADANVEGEAHGLIGAAAGIALERA